MKIDKLDDRRIPPMTDKNANPHKAAGVEFQKILEEIQANQAAKTQKLSEAGSASGGGRSRGALGRYILSRLFLNSEIPSRPGVDPSRLRIRCSVLNVLEEYRNALADPKVSLKDLYPLIQTLSSGMPGMNEGAENLPTNDPLKKILGEIGVLAAVEVERFNRGDYVS